MARRDYTYVTTTCSKGINEQMDLADTDEVAEALNVWAPDGAVVSRPGYVGALPVGEIYQTDSELGSLVDGTDDNVAFEGVLYTGTGTVPCANLAVGETLYLGVSDVPIEDFCAFVLTNANAITTGNTTTFVGEYWNGRTWASVRTFEWDFNNDDFHGHMLDWDGDSGAYLFIAPRDWAVTTVAGASRYWLRLRNVGSVSGTNTDLDGAGDTLHVKIISPISDSRFVGFFPAVFPGTKRYLAIFYNPNSATAKAFLSLSGLTLTNNVYTPLGAFIADEPATLAVVPQFQEAYLAYNYQVTVHKAFPASTDSIVATVEDSVAFVGTGARYNSADVPQLAAWPRAKYMTFFRGELWAAGLEGAPFDVRWSAPVPAYRVWPQLNQRVLMENDNSPITGLFGFGEHMIVFKNDSIWQMVDTGINDFTLQGYSPRKVVSGIGCVSQASVAEVEGRLVFLAEQGLYAFDGVSAKKVTEVIRPRDDGTQKVADRLKKTLARITPGRRPFAVGVNWKSQSCYLLACSLDGSDVNNHVIVWDYKNDSFWVWDDIEAQCWMLDEDSADQERLYFANSKGQVFEFGVGRTSHGATITGHILTQRLGGEDWTYKFRSLELTCSQKSEEVSAEVLRHDQTPGRGVSATFNFTDTLEKRYGSTQDGTVAVYDSSKYTERRERTRRKGFLVSGRWFQVKVAFNQKNQPFELIEMAAGLVPAGRR